MYSLTLNYRRSLGLCLAAFSLGFIAALSALAQQPKPKTPPVPGPMLHDGTIELQTPELNLVLFRSRARKRQRRVEELFDSYQSGACYGFAAIVWGSGRSGPCAHFARRYSTPDHSYLGRRKRQARASFFTEE